MTPYVLNKLRIDSIILILSPKLFLCQHRLLSERHLGALSVNYRVNFMHEKFGLKEAFVLNFFLNFYDNFFFSLL